MKSLLIGSLAFFNLFATEAQENPLNSSDNTASGSSQPSQSSLVSYREKKKERNSPPSSATPPPSSPTLLVTQPEEATVGLITMGDFLYWKPVGDGLPYAVKARSETAPAPLSFAYTDKESVKEVTFSYSPGFRVGIGYQFEQRWNLIAKWTQLNSKGRDSIRVDAPDIIEVIWSFFPGTIPFIKAEQLINYNDVVLVFEKPFFIGSHLSLTPFFGGEMAWLDQKLQVDIPAMNVTFTETPTLANQRSKIKNNFEGGGLNVGVEAEWSICKKLGLYGRGSYGLLYGSFLLTRKDNTNFFPTDAPAVAVPHSERSRDHKVVNMFDIIAGIRGKLSFSKERIELTAHVGYEFSFWPSQVQIYRILSQSVDALLLQGHGDVGFQGLTAGLKLSF